jgi:polysaccharide pyruvyl transferase WcaK-like protein
MFNVKPLSVMPWTGSIRLFGIPTLKSIASTDVTLITDGIIFDVKLFNPLFNFLITLIFLVPWANMLGKPVICYNVGVGPLRSKSGRAFARYVCNRCKLIIVRDTDSEALLREIGVSNAIHLKADAVFDNWGISKSEAESILGDLGALGAAAEGRLLGVNITRYIDAWLASREKMGSTAGFLPMLASVLAKLWVEHGIEPLIVITQHMDHPYGERLQALVESAVRERTGSAQKPGMISNLSLSSHQILGVMSLCRLFVGMRLHSLIISAKAGTPVVGMVYAPKVRSLLAQLGTPGLACELATLDAAALEQTLLYAWQNVDDIRQTQQAVVQGLERSAVEAADLLAQAV